MLRRPLRSFLPRPPPPPRSRSLIFFTCVRRRVAVLYFSPRRTTPIATAVGLYCIGEIDPHSSPDLVGRIAGVSPPPHEREKVAAEEHLHDPDASVAEGPPEGLSERVDVVDAEAGIRAACEASCGGFVPCQLFRCSVFGDVFFGSSNSEAVLPGVPNIPPPESASSADNFVSPTWGATAVCDTPELRQRGRQHGHGRSRSAVSM